MNVHNQVYEYMHIYVPICVSKCVLLNKKKKKKVNTTPYLGPNERPRQNFQKIVASANCGNSQ
jgi:hypothetical protein